VLKQTLQRANRAEVWHSLGEVYAQSNQTEQAISAYQTAIKLARQQQQTTILTNAQISLLELQEFDPTEFQTIDLSIFPGILKAQAHLKIAHSLLNQQPQLALQEAKAALAIGQQLQNPRTEAEAFGLIATVEYQSGNLDTQFVNQAISIAQSVRAWDLAFPSQALLAKIYLAKNQPEKAIQFYQSAISSIGQVRRQIQGTSSNLQFDFDKSVKLIYHQYLELLFDHTENANEIIQTSSQLQITELENFLGCQLEDWTRIEQVSQLPDTTMVFIVRGTDRYHVVLRSQNQPDYRYSISVKALEPIALNLITNVQSEQFASIAPTTILDYGKELYDILLKPAAAKLPAAGTLVFVLDSTLQNLPIDFLHDEQDYLIRKYSLSVTLGAQLRQPKALSANQFKVLLAGISEAAPSFASTQNVLTQTKNELINIQQNTSGKLLLNQDFTIDRLKQVLNQGRYPIVHLSTHGTFSSDPKLTGLLAWDRKLDLTELRKLIEQQSQQKHSIELLVLSACETAEGDQRSVLGLAGVAAQAGARSTIASLWLVDESSTAALMEMFYSGLRAGLPKSEALRQAKLGLMDSEQFQHPFFWGSFILIGSWL
jgi:CHAT domain-containing protein